MAPSPTGKSPAFDCRAGRNGFISTQPPLPRQSAALGDVDGDGRHDTVYYTETTVGFTPAGTATVGYALSPSWSGTWGPVYEARLVGDYNGDGQADLLLSRAGDLLVAYARPGTAGLNAPVFLAADMPSMRLGAERPRSPAVEGDVNADRRLDLVWFDPGRGQLQFDLLDGPRIRARGAGMPVPSGMTPAGQGDFNADGRSDVLLFGSGRGRLLLSTPAGTSVLSETVFAAPSGWDVGGVGDLDFDGYADILLVNYALRQYHVFYMLGAVVAGQYGGAMSDYLPYGDGAEFRIRAVGNLYGNGDSQVVFERASDGYVVVARRSSLSFSDTSRRGLQRDFEHRSGFGGAVAGIADIEGDGQSELLVDQGGGRFAAYRFVSSRDPWFFGFMPVGMHTLPGGFRIESLGDVDDDGDADVIVSNGQQVAVSINGNGI